MLDRNHPAFKKEADPFFNIVMEGLQGEVDGEHFWDAVAEDCVFEFSYQFPGLAPTLDGRAAYMEWFAHYPNVLDYAGDLKIYKDTAKDAVILDYVVKSIAPTGKAYRNFCSIITVKNRKIVHWVDFADTLSAMQAMLEN